MNIYLDISTIKFFKRILKFLEYLFKVIISCISDKKF